MMIASKIRRQAVVSESQRHSRDQVIICIDYFYAYAHARTVTFSLEGASSHPLQRLHVCEHTSAKKSHRPHYYASGLSKHMRQ